MHVHAKPPILVPAEHCREIEKLSKAALMDLAWSFAVRCAGKEQPAEVMAELRAERDAVLAARD
jgi:hypothetical protein